MKRSYEQAIHEERERQRRQDSPEFEDQHKSETYWDHNADDYNDEKQLKELS